MTNSYGDRQSGAQTSIQESQIGHEYLIHLNFLPVDSNFPNFTVYRKLQASPQEPRPSREIMAYRLPPAPSVKDNWPSYWVSFDPIDGFEPFDASSTLNSYLTCRVLFWTLAVATRRVLQPDRFYIPDNAFVEEVSFIQRVHPEGEERLEVQPYYLRAIRQFGYLVNFHFRLREGVQFSRKVQQLSLRPRQVIPTQPRLLR